jgi:hypothetical protein
MKSDRTMGIDSNVDLRLIGDDDPVPLDVAAKIFYPAGGVTEQTRKSEIRKGHLVLELTGGKYFVTKRAINEMRELCRGQRRVPALPPQTARPGASLGHSRRSV